MSNSYLVIIPIYNGEKTLQKLYQQLLSQNVKDILFVDDGSNDNTANILYENHLPFISHEKNLGKGRALFSGIMYAMGHGFDYVLSMDIDLQHPVNQIPNFVEKMEKNRIVIGFRRDMSLMPWQRVFSNRATSFFLSIRTRTKILDSQCGFRLFPTKIIDEVKFTENGFQFESEFLIKCALIGYEIHHVHIPTIYQDEKSSVRNVSDTVKFTSMYLRSYLW